MLFGQYKNNRSLWKVPTIHRNLTCVCVWFVCLFVGALIFVFLFCFIIFTL